jgi:hypothetical protein
MRITAERSDGFSGVKGGESTEATPHPNDAVPVESRRTRFIKGMPSSSSFDGLWEPLREEFRCLPILGDLLGKSEQAQNELQPSTDIIERRGV